MAVVTMRELLDAGTHFGHQTSRWNPKMKNYIAAERNGVYILDLQQTLPLIDQAYEFIKQTVAHGGNILFVGTKRQAQRSVTEEAQRVGMPYVNHRWLGGMLTNFSTVSQRIERMKELEALDFEDVAASGYTKKELLLFERELKKLQASLGGIRDMGRTPSALWVVDTEKEHLAMKEAKALGIPVIAILDSNCDPDDVTYAIPGNDDSIASVALLTRVIADAVTQGLQVRHDQAGTGASSEPAATPDVETVMMQESEQVTQTSSSAVPDMLQILHIAEQSYPGAVIVEIEKEDAPNTFEVELVYQNRLHEFDVTLEGKVSDEDIETEDKNIQRVNDIIVPIDEVIRKVLEQHPHAVVESVELEHEDERLYWEVEIRDQDGKKSEIEISATEKM